MRTRIRAAAALASLLAISGYLVVGCAGAQNAAPAPVDQAAGPSLAAPVRNAGAQPHGPVPWFLTVGGNAHQEAFQALNFFPNTITVDVGDTIQWTVAGNAHTVTFFGRRSSPLKPIGKPYGGSSYDGQFYTSSGAMFPGQTYTLKFTKAGTYPYECLFHDPEMAGTVVVNAKGVPYPHDQNFYDQQGKLEMTHELDAAIGSLDEFPYVHHGTTLAAGIAPGLFNAPPTHSTVLRFLDADSVAGDTVRIPVGTTLTWNNLSNNEPHTVTFPKAGHELPPGKNPFAPPSGGSTYDGSQLTNSGPLFPGQGYSLTFTAKGTFEYYCLFHAPFGMEGTVIVQ